MQTTNYILGQEEVYPASSSIWAFKYSDDIIHGINLCLANMVSRFPFTFIDFTWKDSERLYLCGEFSLDCEEHRLIQQRIIDSNSGFAAKRFVKAPNENFVRKEFACFSPFLCNFVTKIENRKMKVKIQTMLGDIVVRLYDETPIHRDNFLKLAKEGYYDGTLFHRVIKDFMIQGGDPDSKGAPAGKMLGAGGPDYTLEAEIKDGYFHKRGALAAARQGDEVNPERRSSGSQFYIVWGQVYNEGQLRQFSKQLRMQKVQSAFNELAAEHRAEIMQMRRDRNRDGLQELQDKLAAEAENRVGNSGLTDEQLKIYSTVGGTPHLDGQYTVFGEVEEGLDVVEMIQGTVTGRADRPIDDIEMRMSVIE